MPLHPEVAAVRARRLADASQPLYTLPLTRARAAYLAAAQAGGAPEAVGAVLERAIPGPDGTQLVIRVYQPRPPERSKWSDAAVSSERSKWSDSPTSPEPPDPPVRPASRPALVYFFGGGWTLGCLESGDAVCRTLANAAQCVTVAARYRLAPEHPFPAAVEDCHAATRWVADHAAELGVDRRRIAVGGDGAGGNLAAAVTLIAREAGPTLRHQLLVYPNTDCAADTPSLREHDDPLLFNRHSVAWFWQQYLAKREDAADPRASPLKAESFADLPEATVITAEFDPLRDEGEQYALMLLASGVTVDVHRYNGMPHGFFTMPAVYALAREAQAYAAARLAAAFAVG
jgi:acetyl esterase